MSNISLGITSRHSQEPIETNPTQNRGRSRRRRARRRFSAEPRTVRPTRSDGPLLTVKNLQKHVFCSLASRTVRPPQPDSPLLTQMHTEPLLFLQGLADSPYLQFGQSGTSGRTVRHFIADGPQLLFIPSCIILYNSYKIAYSSENYEINFVGFQIMSESY
jgi:hypothetical protein